MNEQFLVFKAEGFEATYTKDGKYGITLFMRRHGLSIHHKIDVLGTVSSLDEAKALINETIERHVSDEPASPEVAQEETLFLGTENPTKGKRKTKKAPKGDA